MTMHTPAEMLDWLGRQLLLAPPQVDVLRPLLHTFPDTRSLGKHLIGRSWLTPFQVNQILQDKGDGLIVGPNRLLERIGEGAMGQVFRAWNTRLDRVVAVKMIHRGHVATGKAMQRFSREMETASQLDHPNIALVRDAGEVDGRPYLVMNFIEGIDLSRRVKTEGPLLIADAVDYARQTAMGLQHACERGVVHRDIKPGNLIVTRQPESGSNSNTGHVEVVKILDFGLARFDSETRNTHRLTQAGNIIGTVRLHRSRTSPGCPRRRHPRRHLQPRLHAVLHPDRQAAVPRRHAGRETGGAHGTGAAERAPSGPKCRPAWTR